MFNNHASASSPVLDSPSKVAGLIFLNSPSRWSTCFLFLFGIVLSSAEGVPSDELSHFFVLGPEFLEALLLTSSSWLSSFELFLVTILRNRTSFISCYSCCAFFIFSLSALKTCSSTIRFLICFQHLPGWASITVLSWISRRSLLWIFFHPDFYTLLSCHNLQKQKGFSVCNHKIY